GDQFIVICQRVLAERTASRRAGDGHLPAARAESRSFAVVVLANRDGLELLDGPQSALDVGWILGVVRAAGPVFFAPFGRFPAQGAVVDRAFQRLGGRRGGEAHAHCRGNDGKFVHSGVSSWLFAFLVCLRVVCRQDLVPMPRNASTLT